MCLPSLCSDCSSFVGRVSSGCVCCTEMARLSLSTSVWIPRFSARGAVLSSLLSFRFSIFNQHSGDSMPTDPRIAGQQSSAKKHHPEMGIHSAHQIKAIDEKKKLRDICFDIERKYGRKRINVIWGATLPKSFDDGRAPRPPIKYRPDNKLQNMDLENFVDIDGKPLVPRCGITFRELKAAHEAKRSKTHTSWAPVQSSTGGQECSECDPDEFMCNSELFEFLDSFKIINDTDVSFILKVTESFSNALVRYKKNSDEKKALPNAAGSNAPHSNINQPSIPSAHGFNRYPEPTTNYTPNQQFPPVSQFNPRGPITEPRFPLSVGSASNIPQGQWPYRMPPPFTAVPSPCFVPFPQGMPPPAMPTDVSRGFPPGFPMANNETNFFASVKNMEVPEVMNNIAATNPALQEDFTLRIPAYQEALDQRHHPLQSAAILHKNQYQEYLPSLVTFRGESAQDRAKRCWLKNIVLLED
ncbi:uncharacterized protein LOC142487225 isoform X2 [Ascaphus truei]|uniref:uncharacterized protein LOC142487225 isoform X2 n=2 Tax=Ascaphus truei TaxID=8439 RepID=UPI003F5A3709